jgi:hypothetical protein
MIIKALIVVFVVLVLAWAFSIYMYIAERIQERKKNDNLG